MDRLRTLIPILDRHPLATDAALATILCALSLLTLRIHWRAADLPPTATTVALTILLFLPLAARRRLPLAALATMTCVLIAHRLVDVPETTWSVNGWWIAVYSAGAYGRERWRDLARAAGMLAITGLVVHETFQSELIGFEGDRVALGILTLLSNGVIFAAVWWLGDSVRIRREQQAELLERTWQLDREREENARRAVLEERVRLARELHDVVAHHVSVMGIQAGAARRVLRRQPDRAEQALATIEAAGRQAMIEMHRLLGLLRQGHDAAALAPQPGLRELDGLVRQMSGAGLPVDVRIQGEARALPPSVDLSAYRIIQEALTNTLRHAGKAAAVVTVRYGDEAVEIEVVDDGRGPVPDRDHAGGNGLIGMRERVGLLGGTLDAGYHPGVGFSVRASLPLGRVAP